MRALTGKDLCKLLERRGWSLLRITEVTTSTVDLGAVCGFPFPFMAARS